MHLPAGVTQEEGHTEFLHLPSAVLGLNFLSRRIQPFFFLVDREVDFWVVADQSFVQLLGILFFFVRKNPSSFDDTKFELKSQRQKVSRLPTEPPGRPA